MCKTDFHNFHKQCKAVGNHFGDALESWGNLILRVKALMLSSKWEGSEYYLILFSMTWLQCCESYYHDTKKLCLATFWPLIYWVVVALIVNFTITSTLVIIVILIILWSGRGSNLIYISIPTSKEWIRILYIQGKTDEQHFRFLSWFLFLFFLAIQLEIALLSQHYHFKSWIMTA